MSSNDDIKLDKIEDRKPANKLPKDIKAVRIDGNIVFFRFWLGNWRQLSADKQAMLKKEFGV